MIDLLLKEYKEFKKCRNYTFLSNYKWKIAEKIFAVLGLICFIAGVIFSFINSTIAIVFGFLIIVIDIILRFCKHMFLKKNKNLKNVFYYTYYYQEIKSFLFKIGYIKDIEIETLQQRLKEEIGICKKKLDEKKKRINYLFSSIILPLIFFALESKPDNFPWPKTIVIGIIAIYIYCLIWNLILLIIDIINTCLVNKISMLQHFIDDVQEVLDCNQKYINEVIKKENGKNNNKCFCKKKSVCFLRKTQTKKEKKKVKKKIKVLTVSKMPERDKVNESVISLF